MRKILLTILFVFILPPTALGFGISTTTMWNEYPKAIDFKSFPIVEEMDKLFRPIAGFEVTINDVRQVSTDTAFIISAQDSNTIKANVGDKIKIHDRSLASGKINQYDIQYRFTPAGEKRENYNLVPAIVSNWNQVQNIIENIELTEPGELEIY